LLEGSCDSVYWGKKLAWNDYYDGVEARLWFPDTAQEKDAAEKAAAEKAATEKAAAAKKAIEEKAMKGLGHWFVSYDGRKTFCVQENGDKIGDEQVTKHFRDVLTQKPCDDSILSC